MSSDVCSSDLGKEFDENNFTVFQGTRETCHKPVFGLINCCAGKVSGLLTVGAGAAALAGGPTAVAALATPFLTLFACSQSEMRRDLKDRKIGREQGRERGGSFV